METQNHSVSKLESCKVLALFLFVIAIEYAVRKGTATADEDNTYDFSNHATMQEGAVDIYVQKISNPDFGDDIGLCSVTVQDAQTLLTNVEETSAQVDLDLYEVKTKCVMINIQVKDEERVLRSRCNEMIESEDRIRMGGLKHACTRIWKGEGLERKT